MSGRESEEEKERSKAELFEDSVGTELDIIFGAVEHHPKIIGFSGVKWRVDFVVNSDLIVEATVQRRAETKISSTFVKFADIVRSHPHYRAALVFERLQTGFHRTKGKKYFPSSEYRVMIGFGFPIIEFDKLRMLKDFVQGSVDSMGASSSPRDFVVRSLNSKKMVLANEILQLLRGGPLARREIAAATGRRVEEVDDAVRVVPRIRKVSSYYGLSAEEIMIRLARKEAKSRRQARLAREWLEAAFLKRLASHEDYSSVEFAKELGVNQISLSRQLHSMNREGKIRRTKTGWALPVEP